MKRSVMVSVAAVATALAGCTGNHVTFVDVERSVAAVDVAQVSLASYPGQSYSRSTSYSASRKPKRWNAVSAGPRMGVLHVTGEAVETLETELEAGPTMTLWGWQFEYQYIADLDPDTPIGLVEFVPAVVGLDQGLALPTGSILLGMRFVSGFEAAAGPNVSPSGAGMCVAIGKTLRAGSMCMPINFAVVSNGDGQRYSLTFGWNLEQ